MNASSADDDDIFEAEESRPRSSKNGKRRKSAKSKTPTWVIVLIICAGVPLLMCPCLIALLLPAVQQAREAARRSMATNHLKQVGLAMHNFHDTYNHFPPLSVEGAVVPGEQVQSWMTDILPYMDQAALYDSIHRNSAWDAPDNRMAMGTVVPSYINPSQPTLPVDASSGYAVAHFAANSQVVSDRKFTGLRDITDGSSNTILVGSVADGFKPWGDPTNHRDPALGVGGGAQAFVSPHPGVVLFLLADGSVRLISKDTSPAVMTLLANPADGNPLPPGVLDGNR